MSFYFKNMSRTRIASYLLGTTMMAGLTATGATAQEVGGPAQDSQPVAEESQGVGTIIVTARKKQEDLQDVPVAVSAITGDTVDRYGFGQIDEIVERIPNVKITTGGAGAGGSIFFRGIGANSNAGAFEPSLALNVDGATVSTARIVQNSFFDVESIELLKGPQALFFGKAATAGALSVRTRNPGNNFEISADTGYEFEQESWFAEGVVSGPITDTLGVRAAVRYRDTQNFVRNIAEGVANPRRGEESFDFRGTLQWQPVDDLDIVLKYTRLDYENDGAAQRLSHVTRSILTPGDDKNAPAAFVGTPFQSGGVVPGLTIDQIGIPDAPQVANSPGSEYLRDGVPYSENLTQFFNANVTYDISPDYRIVGTFGWTKIEDTGFDNFSQDYNVAGASGSLNEFDFKTYELRLEAEPAAGFSFMLGGFYEDSNQFFEAEQYAGLAALGRLALGVEATTPGFEGAFYDVRKAHDTDSEIFALFGSAEWEITDGLTLSGGVRYTDVTRDGTIDVSYLHDFLIDIGTNDLYASTVASVLFGADPDAIAIPGTTVNFRQLVQGIFGGAPDTRGGTFSTPAINYEENATNIEATLDYEFVPDSHIYISYKEAFKPGGIDNSITAFNSDITNLTAAGEGVIFEGENVDGFEIGYKGLLFDNSLRLNGVFYNYDYTDFQIQSFNAAALAFLLTNAGELKSQGIELDIEYVPYSLDGLSLYASVAWDNSEFVSYTDPTTGHILDGRRPSAIAEWSGVFGLDYETTLGSSGWGFDVGAAARWTGDYFVNNQYSGNCGGCPTEALPPFEQDGYVAFDLRAGISTPDERWNVSFIANNLTDERYLTFSGGIIPGSGPLGDDIAGGINEGRTLTLRVGFKF